MRTQNSYRVINEDIAALRNIAWAASKRAVYHREVYNANLVLGIASLLLCPNKDTGDFIGSLLVAAEQIE